MKRIALIAAGLAVCVCSAICESEAEHTAPLPEALPAVEVKIEEFAENPNEEMHIEQALLAQANVIKDCCVTYYCAEPYEHICGMGLGITKSGRPLQPNHSVAVDPSVIPLGSQIMVDFGDGIIHYYFAEDVGGAVKGNHIDICLPTHAECFEQPHNTATVYWIGE